MQVPLLSSRRIQIGFKTCAIVLLGLFSKKHMDMILVVVWEKETCGTMTCGMNDSRDRLKVCFQPRCNPLWLMGLEEPTKYWHVVVLYIISTISFNKLAAQNCFALHVLAMVLLHYFWWQVLWPSLCFNNTVTASFSQRISAPQAGFIVLEIRRVVYNYTRVNLHGRLSHRSVHPWWGVTCLAEQNMIPGPKVHEALNDWGQEGLQHLHSWRISGSVLY